MTLLTIKEAATMLGVGRNTLLAALRKEKVFNDQNIPMLSFVQRGYFQTKTGCYKLPGTKIVRHHCKVFVTDIGMSFLAQLLASMNNDKRKAT